MSGRPELDGVERLHPEGRRAVANYTATVNWWVYPNDPDVFPYYHSQRRGKGFNIPGYKDPKLDDLLDAGSRPRRDLASASKAVYKQLQTFMADNLPYLFLWYPQEIDVISQSAGRAGPRSARQHALRRRMVVG